MLHAAAAADAKVRTTRRNALGAGLQNPQHLGLLKLRLDPVGRKRHPLTGQRPFDENDLAVNVGNAAPLVVEGLDDGFAAGSVAHWLGVRE